MTSCHKYSSCHNLRSHASSSQSRLSILVELSSSGQGESQSQDILKHCTGEGFSYVTAGGPVTSGGIEGPYNLHMPLALTVPSAASLALAPGRRAVVGALRRVSAAAASDTRAEGLVNWLRESGLPAQKVPRQPFLSCKLFCSSLGGPQEPHLCINVNGSL